MHHNCSGKPQKRIRRGWGDVDTTFRSRGDVVFSLHGCTRIGQASHSSGCDKAGVMLTLLSGAGVMLFSLHGCTRIGQASHRCGFDKAGVMLTVLSGAGVVLGSAFAGAPELVREATNVDVTRLCGHHVMPCMLCHAMFRSRPQGSSVPEFRFQGIMNMHVMPCYGGV